MFTPSKKDFIEIAKDMWEEFENDVNKDTNPDAFLKYLIEDSYEDAEFEGDLNEWRVFVHKYRPDSTAK